jgi:hypothetical protein
LRISPAFSSFWIRRQHGVEDRPISSASSASGSAGILLQPRQDLEIEIVELGHGRAPAGREYNDCRIHACD